MKNYTKKAFFFDYDGTLWFGQYGEKTIEALKKLKEKGHYVFYNSGRSRGNTRFERLTEIPFDGFIFGGCHVEIGGKTLFRKDLTKKQIEVVLALEKEYDLHIVYEAVFGVYKRRGIMDWLVGEEMDDINVLLNVEKFPVSKMSIVKQKDASGAYVQLPKCVLDELKRHFKLIDFESYVECVQPDLGKAVMAQKVIDELKMDISNVYAFGDSMNDYEMFTWCKRGVAIGQNASEPLKEIAVYVSKEDLNGVYEALTELKII